ncbi:Arc family DNA-binding protein [Acidovorax sp. Root217]|uniref:Arc family DNA-binding protein n=1 Tax=Acidovorax sp. Root217 TaxID=1736492 RepID=UPI0009E7D64B|nr:Arc family DNA-binding protein [Acidovorax sp. Root217]
MTTEHQQLPPTPVRLPPEFKAQLQAEAKANDRSLNGEILARLRSTFKAKRSTTTQQKGQSQ